MRLVPKLVAGIAAVAAAAGMGTASGTAPGVESRQAAPPRGPWLGQAPAGRAPTVFAPGVVSTPHDEHGVPVFAQTGTEFYLSRVVGSPPEFENVRFRMDGDGAWTHDVVRLDRAYRHAELVPARDGRRLFYTSQRPLGGDAARPVWHLWVTDVGGRQDVPRPLPPPVNSAFHECQLFEAADGSIYFTSWRNGRPDLFRAVERGKTWTLDADFGPGLNSGDDDKGAFVSDDGALLLFWSNRAGGRGTDDIYLSRRGADGRWGAPVNAGPLVNSPAREWYPRLSPDGRSFFFLSDRAGDLDVYWIDAAVLASSAPPSAQAGGAGDPWTAPGAGRLRYTTPVSREASGS